MSEGGEVTPKEELANLRETFEARAKNKIKQEYISGSDPNSLNDYAENYREEADILFSGDTLDEHLRYVELLVEAGREAVKQSPVDFDDPDVLFSHDPEVSWSDLEREGERFEKALDNLTE